MTKSSESEVQYRGEGPAATMKDAIASVKDAMDAIRDASERDLRVMSLAWAYDPVAHRVSWVLCAAYRTPPA